MDERVQSSDDIIDASKIVVTIGTMPTRIVLRKLPGKFVTHMEMLSTAAPRKGYSCAFEHHGFAQGHYFDFESEATKGLSLPSEKDALERAYADFKERASKL